MGSKSIIGEAERSADTLRSTTLVNRIANIKPEEANEKPEPKEEVKPATKRLGRPVKENKVPMSRLTLKLPTELKEYLYAAAYYKSTPKHMYSLTEYLCQLIREDMKRTKYNPNE